ncbi:MAG TPA: DUF2784 domain-containing protein [Steroidobacteraceae bacterium]|nr:DUF2784 domain-containing protein [Steroidobacteraceae bacterium]
MVWTERRHKHVSQTWEDFLVPPYQVLADAVLLLHFAVVLFIVGGLAFVVAGNIWHWPGANNIWFRLAHLTAIGVVILQSWLGQLCPLTTLESWLRTQSGAPPMYDKSFIEHWVQRLLFYEAPFWLFVLIYTAFGLLVVSAWWRYPPRRAAHGHRCDA